jgi:hypothetical protein
MKTKRMMFNSPKTLHALLQHLTDQLIHYASYQIQSGAQVHKATRRFDIPQHYTQAATYKPQILQAMVTQQNISADLWCVFLMLDIVSPVYGTIVESPCKIDFEWDFPSFISYI